MTKQEVETKLKKALKSIENDNNYKKNNVDIRIQEKAKCPKCGTYEGDGYTISNFLIYIEKCDKCGHYFDKD